MKPLRKLLVFDLDETLVKSNCWKDLHEHFASVECSKRNFELYKKRLLDYSEWMNRDIRCLGYPRYEEVRKILLDYELSEGVEEFFASLNEHYYTAIISCGIDVRAKRVAEQLGIDFTCANSFIVKNGRVVRGIPAVSPENKGQVVKSMREALGIERRNVIGVGDSRFDERMLAECGMKIAFNCRDELKRIADCVIEKFGELSEVLDAKE